MATMIEAPLDLQKSLTIPKDHLAVCASQGLPTVGNAAGNTKELFDLKGENLPPAPLPSGFTARGIVALTFSCLSAFLGMAIIAWYGIGEVGTSKATGMKSSIGVPLTEFKTRVEEGRVCGMDITE